MLSDNAIIAICVASIFVALFLSVAWCQWLISCHARDLAMRVEAERTARWQAYYESVAQDCDVEAPRDDEPPDEEDQDE